MAQKRGEALEGEFAQLMDGAQLGDENEGVAHWPRLLRWGHHQSGNAQAIENMAGVETADLAVFEGSHNIRLIGGRGCLAAGHNASDCDSSD